MFGEPFFIYAVDMTIKQVNTLKQLCKQHNWIYPQEEVESLLA